MVLVDKLKTFFGVKTIVLMKILSISSCSRSSETCAWNNAHHHACRRQTAPLRDVYVSVEGIQPHASFLSSSSLSKLRQVDIRASSRSAIHPSIYQSIHPSLSVERDDVIDWSRTTRCQCRGLNCPFIYTLTTDNVSLRIDCRQVRDQ